MDCSTYISPARLHLLCFAPGLPICTLALFRLLRARRTPCVALRPPTSLPMCHHATACRSCHRASLCHGTASGRISGREGGPLRLQRTALCAPPFLLWNSGRLHQRRGGVRPVRARCTQWWAGNMIRATI